MEFHRGRHHKKSVEVDLVIVSITRYIEEPQVRFKTKGLTYLFLKCISLLLIIKVFIIIRNQYE